MKLELAILCYAYQHRLCWLLSSLLQQVGNKPEMVISIAYPPNNGNPTTEEVIAFFRDKGLNIIDVVLTEDEAKNRSISRNIRTKATDADWILYADCDLVYDPHFFEDLKIKLESDQFKNETKAIGADRHSLNIDFCVNYFKNDKNVYPCDIPNVASITAQWPIKWISGKCTCAGYHQLARVQAIKDKGGFYTARNRDFMRATKGDRAFRCMMGGRVPMDTLPIYHLNHTRETGIQR